MKHHVSDIPMTAEDPIRPMPLPVPRGFSLGEESGIRKRAVPGLAGALAALAVAASVYMLPASGISVPAGTAELPRMGQRAGMAQPIRGYLPGSDEGERTDPLL